MDFGVDMIGLVKTNKKEFCKDTIEKFTKYCPGGCDLVSRIKPMVPGGRPISAIGYKYNSWKVLYFIATEDAGIKKSGIPYLSKLPEPFSNVDIRPVDRPIVMSKFFGYVNELDSQKNQGSLI